MATLARIQALWQNFSGAPGYSNFFSTDTTGNMNASVRAFFQAIAGILPSGLTVQVAASGDLISDTTGQITGAWSNAGVAVVTGSSGGVNTGASGAVVHWKTDTVVNGRRIRGRTFLCPLATTAFSASGQVTSGAISTIQTAGAGLITAAGGSLVVWHRPTDFSAGSSGVVTTSSVPVLAAVLRSRRV